MSEAKLDQIVKGAPSPNVTLPQVAAENPGQPDENTIQQIIEEKKPASHSAAADPTASLPSSPPQIYLNLLILEASLRAQYLTLRARRRQHVFFLNFLTIWTGFFAYVLFFRPREDGKGVGGSPYWLFDVTSKICFMGGVLTAVLIWATGQWERGVRWPRRWLGITNRGLRGMNLKMVVIKGPWYRRVSSYVALFVPYSLLFNSTGSAFHYIDYPEKRHAASSSRFMYREGHQFKHTRLEDTSHGGDYIRLLLLPKPFSPEFRENWELYRDEYWARENQRRAELRKVHRRRQKQLAKEQGGWLWWIGWRGWRHKKTERDVEKTFPRHSSQQKRRRSSAHRDQHSRSSSRSSATPELDEVRNLRRSTRKPRAFLSPETPTYSKRASTISSSSTTSEAGDSEKSSVLLEE
ncbi:MAG: hypothetical protein Q9162_007891 [Coniocarpon cinnabarinum]